MSNKNKASLIDFINPSRNHLTLIIAGICLLCLAVSIGFGWSSASLEPSQRWVFIIFLIIFPFVGLLLAVWLILRHFRKLTVASEDDSIPWRIMSPEKQQRKLNFEVGELAKLLNIENTQLGDLRSAYIVAEDLALRNIELESEISLKRHVSLDKACFDAVLIKENIIRCIEVGFAITTEVSQEKINQVQRNADALKRTLERLRPHTKLILTFIMVTQLDPGAEAKLRSNVSKQFPKPPVDVEIRWFDFETLQKTYTT